MKLSLAKNNGHTALASYAPLTSLCESILFIVFTMLWNFLLHHKIQKLKPKQVSPLTTKVKSFFIQHKRNAT